MAPDSPAGKRKRGRTRLGQNNKQRADASGGQHMARRDGDDDDDRPKKRGKVMEKHVDSPPAMDAQPRKRERPRKSLDDAAQHRLQPEDEPQPGPSRKGRKRQQAPQEPQQEPLDQRQEAAPEAAPEAPRRRHKRQWGPQAQRSEPTDKQPATDEAPRRKRARPSLQNPEPAPRGKRGRPPVPERPENEVAHQEADEEPDARTRNRARPSQRGVSPSQAQNGPAERRKKGQRPSQTQEKSDQERTRRENRPSGAMPTTGSSNRRRAIPEPSLPVTEPRDPKRRRSRQHVDEDDAAPVSPSAPPPSPPKPYVHIVPRVRHVRQSTIAAKWSPLTGPSLSAVSALLQLAHQPILQRLSSTHQRRAHASAALRLMARRISRKVAARGLPFPPASMPAASRRGGQQQQQPSDGGRETELDFESVLDAKAALEAQLGPAAHAVELLRRERDSIEKELERDYETLRELEARARSQTREQRGLLKKAHALTPLAMIPEQPYDARAEEGVLTASGLATATTSSGNLFTGLAADDANTDDGGELRQLAVQLGGHVESMRANLRQADGIVPQLARARAALQAALHTHLDQDQYERVVLG
ncbi:CENP-Q, a CENPA-CAD centromere complex subunit [Hirsutella rhossiliensis]|uniref:CENP-Q, a CENPA-CAD centromere complex subunit domain-containing protein n=1 Tax=Hirsutella rhossiliensis TaxID=111463 RepID=A0A9P8MT51_9HYPO|nr:CENP-Q, a CENPA-CAD centromere complex subunit domain-containing protein [Hirsutella rhossiliensis]KAH0960820.1 CENP-Q, a CENPA-CAD centromere complex subunit domain-containing protein [Hirsutella rhossiliensis]